MIAAVIITTTAFVLSFYQVQAYVPAGFRSGHLHQLIAAPPPPPLSLTRYGLHGPSNDLTHGLVLPPGIEIHKPWPARFKNPRKRYSKSGPMSAAKRRKRQQTQEVLPSSNETRVAEADGHTSVDHTIIFSQLKSLLQLLTLDPVGAITTQMNFFGSYSEIGDSIPVVGLVKGLIQLSFGFQDGMSLLAGI